MQTPLFVEDTVKDKKLDIDVNVEAFQPACEYTHTSFMPLVSRCEVWKESILLVNGNNLLVPWDPGVWLPKYGEDVEAIEGLPLTVHKKTLTAMRMDRCVPNDHMRCWRVTFGAAVHSSWAAFNDVMVVTSGGAKTNVVINGADTLQDFEAAVHMREAAFVDSLGSAFCGGTWKGRTADLRTVLRYSETFLDNTLTAVWRVETLDSLGMHWHFVGTEMFPSWAALLRTKRLHSWLFGQHF